MDEDPPCRYAYAIEGTAAACVDLGAVRSDLTEMDRTNPARGVTMTYSSTTNVDALLCTDNKASLTITLRCSNEERTPSVSKLTT
jgi:hypothetical protein